MTLWQRGLNYIKNMEKLTINEISIQIHDLIERAVEEQNTNQEYKESLESFIQNSNYFLEEARDTLEDFKSQGLSINTIEAEGYLRAVLTIQSMLPDID